MCIKNNRMRNENNWVRINRLRMRTEEIGCALNMRTAREGGRAGVKKQEKRGGNSDRNAKTAPLRRGLGEGPVLRASEDERVYIRPC